MIDWSDIERRLAAHWDATPRAEEKMLSLAIGGISEGLLRNKMRGMADRAETRRLIKKLVRDGKLAASRQRHNRNRTAFTMISNPFAEKLRDECSRAFDIFYMSAGQSMTFDVSQRCDHLMMSIQEAVRAASFHLNGSKFLVELSDDCRELTISCVEEKEQ